HHDDDVGAVLEREAVARLLVRAVAAIARMNVDEHVAELPRERRRRVHVPSSTTMARSTMSCERTSRQVCSIVRAALYAGITTTTLCPAITPATNPGRTTAERGRASCEGRAAPKESWEWS